MGLSNVVKVVRCCVGIVLCFVNLVESDNLTQLNLIGLFPVTGSWDRGLAIKPAAEMALQDINNRQDILPGYLLNIFYNDTMCDPGLGIKAVADNVCHPPVKLMIIGEGCSTVSQAVAQVSHRWNLIQISYASTSPALSNLERYPDFFRLVMSEVSMNKARIELLRHFRWKRVATLNQDFQLFSMMVEDLLPRFSSEGIEHVVQAGFTDNPEPAIARLKRAGARIIIGGFYPNKARKVFCAAYRMGFYGKQVWITPTAIAHNMWWEGADADDNCTSEQILTALRGTFIIHNVLFNADPAAEGFTGMSVNKFKERFDEKTKHVMPKPVSGYDRAPNGYDSVWAAALALNKTMNHLKNDGSGRRLSDFSYTDHNMKELIKSKLLEVEFDSVSGHVAFDSNGDGVRLVGVEMVRGDEIVNVGTYDKDMPKGEKLIMKDVYTGKVPLDDRERVPYTLSIPIYITITTISSLGIVLSLLFLIFNCKNRHVKIIKMSSPKINNIILAGCILAYLSVFVEDVRDTRHSVFCKLKIFLILMAFSLSFGALFAKTWRIYTVFTASLQMKKRSVQDVTLFLLIAALVAVNSVVLVIWFIVDPQTFVTEDILDKYVASYCWSENQKYFFIVILVIQGVFLLLGVFLAWETRKVKFSTLNESHYIGMCIYNVVALGVVGVLVAYSIRNNPPLVYIVIATITILCTTVTQCLLFVPKILAFRKFCQGKLKDVTPASSNSTELLQVQTTTRASQTDSWDFRDDGLNTGHL